MTPSATLPGLPQNVFAHTLFDGEHMRDKVLVTLVGGLISAVNNIKAPPAGAIVLPEDAILAPGLIDLQVNGGGGALLNNAPTADTVRTMLTAHRARGTTGMLPTLITDHPDRLHDLAAAAPEIARIGGVLGVHLEGPFLNRARKGVHPAEFIRMPQHADLDTIVAIRKHLPVLITLAPECVAAGFILQLVKAGIIVSIGHSDATAEQVTAACDEGATGITHLFNAMSQISGRAPGVVGAAFDDARLTAGIICDSLHVASSNVRTAIKAMGPDRLALVTDAMPTVGSGNSTFDLHGRTITLTSGRLTAPDGTLAGAHLGMLDAVRMAKEMTGGSLGDALIMASRTPARFLGLSDSRGRIAPGFAADLITISKDVRLLGSWIGGQPVSIA